MVTIKGEITKATINTLTKKILNKAVFNGTNEEFLELVEIANSLYDIAKTEIYSHLHSAMNHDSKQLTILTEREITDRIKRS